MGNNLPTSLDEVFFDRWEDLGHGEKQKLAKTLKKPLSTLSHELSIYDSGAKLGVNEFSGTCKAPGTIGQLTCLANKTGFDLVIKEREAPDAPTFCHEVWQTHQHLNEFHRVRMAFREGKATREDISETLRKLKSELDQDETKAIDGDDCLFVQEAINHAGYLKTEETQQ